MRRVGHVWILSIQLRSLVRQNRLVQGHSSYTDLTQEQIFQCKTKPAQLCQPSCKYKPRGFYAHLSSFCLNAVGSTGNSLGAFAQFQPLCWHHCGRRDCCTQITGCSLSTIHRLAVAFSIYWLYSSVLLHFELFLSSPAKTVCH